MGKFYISKTNKKIGYGYVNPFADEATPGFELGKRDLQSPALPLGHAAKTIQNIWNPLKLKKKKGVFSISFFFLLKKEKVEKGKGVFSTTKYKSQNKLEALTTHREFMNYSCIWIQECFSLT